MRRQVDAGAVAPGLRVRAVDGQGSPRRRPRNLHVAVTTGRLRSMVWVKTLGRDDGRRIQTSGAARLPPDLAPHRVRRSDSGQRPPYTFTQQPKFCLLVENTPRLDVADTVPGVWRHRLQYGSYRDIIGPE
jgi:hypothetical protein